MPRRADLTIDPVRYRASLWGRLNRRRYERAMRLVCLRPDDRILDLGCGNGLKSGAAWNRRNPVLGVDRLDPARVLPLGDNFEYQRADVLDLADLPAGTFDVVVSFGLLEHLTDAEVQQVLRESRR